ncbi:hypothetical protein [Parvicella tangerina]|uniref:Protein SirB1 N-terminal domain-containing protein n=1 Tax=Parvicella tangerina TaxID=2829795 RepID=A0A916JQ82_9FLAO|nr:hypothetical protein [Parvicella tangerina]CAG5086804.1 hypothetical protein CRYO30217_03287 [Parvicella tangerina]
MRYIIIILVSIYYSIQAQEVASTKTKDIGYEKAYYGLTGMLMNEYEYSLKNAVYMVENAFLGNLDLIEFYRDVKELAYLVNEYAYANADNFAYNHSDRNTMLFRASLFSVFTDTIPIQINDSLEVYHLPFTYDFKDFTGDKDWTKMFVSKLLKEKNGNCHSLPLLYKILAEESGISASLALAPNHIYIKHRSVQGGMYNTELTSAAFPLDAWLMASGYIHLDAIRSGIYMDTLNDTQTISLCLVDLAKGYEKKYGHIDDEFIELCLDKALEYYPNYINALLFKAEVIKRKLDNNMSGELFQEYENLVIKIYKLGYRKMPEKMYLNWLLDLKENKAMYSNEKIVKLQTQSK